MGAIFPTTANAARKSTGTTTWQRLWRERWMYIFIIPGLLYFGVFRYLPLLGNIIAFQEYSPFLGFFDSPFVGLENFRRIVTDPDVILAIQNTLSIAVLQLVLFFPAPIVLALLLNTLAYEPIKRLMQSVLYLPHFLSWVIIVALWQQMLGGGRAPQSGVADGGAPTRSTSWRTPRFSSRWSSCN